MDNISKRSIIFVKSPRMPEFRDIPTTVDGNKQDNCHLIIVRNIIHVKPSYKPINKGRIISNNRFQS